MLRVTDVDIYYGRQKVIKSASFSIKAGEIVGLIGPNGAGKSTIMKTILGLTKFTGKVIFDGQQVTTTQHTALQRVGALIENPALYPFLTGRENLSLYASDRKEMEKIILMLKMDRYIDQRTKEYSIGMKQKLGIALALLNHPQLVILDEPMNGLDIEATILIRKIIQQYALQGTAFLISSHVLSELQKVMTSLIILNHHKIVMDVPISRFKDIQIRQYQLKTTDNTTAESILISNNITFKHQQGAIVIRIEDCAQIQKLLYQHQILLRELIPVRQTFEQMIVDILREKEGANNEN